MRGHVLGARCFQQLQRMGVDLALARSGMRGVPTIRDVSDVTGQVVDRPNPLYKNLPGGHHAEGER
ncbi:MAG TPA: hypothetical protein VLK85_07640 [Ramlibacter sp.]|nr:hypothetical protein [Ramlibacter sp.]